MKYRDIVRDVVSRMNDLGINGVFPNLNYSDENRDEAADNIDEKRRLQFEHFAEIDDADIAYWITKDGHLGTSCKIELGYAIAKGKPVYFSEPTNDIGVDCFLTGIIPLDDLEKFEEIKK